LNRAAARLAPSSRAASTARSASTGSTISADAAHARRTPARRGAAPGRLTRARPPTPAGATSCACARPRSVPSA
jgi:hypothetical protein